MDEYGYLRVGGLQGVIPAATLEDVSREGLLYALENNEAWTQKTSDQGDRLVWSKDYSFRFVLKGITGRLTREGLVDHSLDDPCIWVPGAYVYNGPSIDFVKLIELYQSREWTGDERVWCSSSGEIAELEPQGITIYTMEGRTTTHVFPAVGPTPMAGWNYACYDDVSQLTGVVTPEGIFAYQPDGSLAVEERIAFDMSSHFVVSEGDTGNLLAYGGGEIVYRIRSADLAIEPAFTELETAHYTGEGDIFLEYKNGQPFEYFITK